MVMCFLKLIKVVSWSKEPFPHHRLSHACRKHPPALSIPGHTATLLLKDGQRRSRGNAKMELIHGDAQPKNLSQILIRCDLFSHF